MLLLACFLSFLCRPPRFPFRPVWRRSRTAKRKAGERSPSATSGEGSAASMEDVGPEEPQLTVPQEKTPKDKSKEKTKEKEKQKKPKKEKGESKKKNKGEPSSSKKEKKNKGEQ